jgi:hypothetical protein
VWARMAEEGRKGEAGECYKGAEEIVIYYAKVN